MGLAWSDTYTNADDLSDFTFCKMIRDNIEQRCAFGGGPDVNPTFASGNDFQDHALWTLLQTNLQNVVGAYLKSTALTGATFAAVQSTTFTWDWAGVTAAVLGGNGWTRKYPREHTDAASTVYTDGSAFANGHVSRRVSDGMVYNRTAGAWVLAAAGTLPDEITAYGVVQIGDYIGPWIFNELRDVCNLLTAVPHFDAVGWTADGIANERDGQELSAADANAAETSALANFDAFANTVNGNAPTCFAWSGTGGQASCGRLKAKFSFTNDKQFVAGEVDFWSEAGARAPQTGHPPPVFDANGDTVANGTLVAWDTGVACAAFANVKSAYLGSLGHPTFPAAQDGTEGGYSVGHWIAVIRYDVAGGFSNHL